MSMPSTGRAPALHSATRLIPQKIQGKREKAVTISMCSALHRRALVKLYAMAAKSADDLRAHRL